MSIWGDIHKRANGESLRQEDTIFKEMVYGSLHGDQRSAPLGLFEPEIFAYNMYKGMEYYVVSDGNYPCAYVVCDKKFLDDHVQDYEFDEIQGVHVHGGITFIGQMGKLKAFKNHPELKDKYCIGWDYGHSGDWEGYYSFESNRGTCKYTTKKIVHDCKCAIDDILDIKDFEKTIMDSVSEGINIKGDVKASLI